MRAAVVLALVLLLAACGGSSEPARVYQVTQPIARAELGEAWPLVVDAGDLVCRPDGSITFKVDSLEYAVNGVAQAKYRAIDPIWADDPTAAGLKLSLEPLNTAGQALCDQLPD